MRIRNTAAALFAASLAGSSYRASLRPARIVRTATPFGRIRNASPLGNGVSVIRVCLALGFDDDDDGDDDDDDDGKSGVVPRGGGEAIGSLLGRLHGEERELRARTEILLPGMDDAYGIRRRALGNYLSNVAAAYLHHRECITHGSVDSTRVPFARDAVPMLRRAAKEERSTFDGLPPPPTKTRQSSSENDTPRRDAGGTTKSYVVATILLAIKGDRTSVKLPMMGILRRRDVASALGRIKRDVEVEDCLIACEVMTSPDARRYGGIGDDDGGSMVGRLITEEEMLGAFPDLVPLT